MASFYTAEFSVSRRLGAGRGISGESDLLEIPRDEDQSDEYYLA